MIISFCHKGLQDFFNSGSKRGIQPSHAKKLVLVLAALNAASAVADVNLPGFKLHQLSGNLAGHWSIWVNANWRVTFKFVGADVELVDYQDYH